MTPVQHGVSVIVDGEVVAWFAVFNESAHDWCSMWHFGRWITWPSEAPALVELTPEQEAKAKARAEELFAFFNEQE